MFGSVISCSPVCQCLVTLVYLCFAMFTRVYLCLPPLTRAYLCLTLCTCASLHSTLDNVDTRQTISQVQVLKVVI